jgi:hypothetical protein
MPSSIRKFLFVGALLSCLAVGLFSREAFSQGSTSTASTALPAGRYQLFSPSRDSRIYVIDTQTGQAWWYFEANNRWDALPPLPVSNK